MSDGPYDDQTELLDREPADEPTASQLRVDDAAPLPRQHGIWRGVPGGWLCTCGCGRRLDEQLRFVPVRRAS
jgi:hypothetical protein